MTGELKEYLYVENLLRQIETAEKAEPGKMAPYFQLPSSEGKDLKRTDFKDKYLLLHFWASWDEKSKESNQMLRKIYKDKKNIRILKYSASHSILIKTYGKKLLKTTH